MVKAKLPWEQEIFPSSCIQIDLATSREQSQLWNLRAQAVKTDNGYAEKDTVYEIKVCPFVLGNEILIFACTCGPNVFVYRVTSRDDPTIEYELLRAVYDVDGSQNTKSRGLESFQMIHCLAWMQDPSTNEPLLLFSGVVPKIHVYNVATGQYVKSLTGHGSAIQEIVPHPTVPSVFATCADDNEIRLWNLDSQYPKSQCAVICHGQHGHNSTIFSIAFTKNGRYVISGGRDTYINLWSLPSEEKLRLLPEQPDRSHRISLPHFSSAEIHTDIIDCLRFYGDFIFSRSVNSEIICWTIDGFSCRDPVPKEIPAERRADLRTYSAFGGKFTLICKFAYGRNHTVYYNRFSIFPGFQSTRPKLAMGSTHEGPVEVYLWDLQNIEENTSTNFVGDYFDSAEHQQVLRPRGLKLGKRDSFGGFRIADWSRDGKYLVAGFDKNMLIIWRLKDHAG